MISRLVAMSLLVVSVRAFSQGDPKCGAILKYGLWENNISYSRLDAASSASEWFCDTNTVETNDQKDGLLDIVGVASLDVGAKSASASYRQLCGDSRQSSTTSSQQMSAWRRASDKIVGAWATCLNQQMGLTAWAQRVPEAPDEITIIARYRTPRDTTDFARDVHLVAPKNMRCQKTKFPEFGYNGTSLACERIDSHKLASVRVESVLPANDGQNTLVIAAAPKPERVHSLTMTFDSFYSAGVINGLDATEIKLFDRLGRPVKITSIEASSSHPGTSSNVLHDGIIEHDPSSGTDFWAPVDKRADGVISDDVGQWLRIEFEPTDALGRIDLYQVWQAWCMVECSDDPSKVDVKKAKIRRNLNDATIQFSNNIYQKVTFADQGANSYTSAFLH